MSSANGEASGAPASSSTVGAVRCQRCGAPLDVTPETIVAICPYCGYPNWMSQAFVYPIVLVPANSRKAVEYFQRYLESDRDMRGIKDKITIKSIETIYFPVYLIDVSAVSHYRGSGTVTLEKTIVKEKGEVETRTRIVDVYIEGVYQTTMNLDIIARRFVDETVVEHVIRHYKKTRPNETPIDKVNWEDVKGTVLSSELTSDDAALEAKDKACEIVRKEVEEKMNNEAFKQAVARHPGWMPVSVSWDYQKIPCRSRIEKISPIILLPYILVVYGFEGKVYKSVFAGWDGARVYGEEPITGGRRTLYFASTIISSLIGGAGLVTLAASVTGSETLLGALMTVLGLGGAYVMAGKTIADVRVEEE